MLWYGSRISCFYPLSRAGILPVSSSLEVVGEFIRNNILCFPGKMPLYISIRSVGGDKEDLYNNSASFS